MRDWPSAIDAATGGAVIDAVMDLVGGAMTNPLIEVMTSHSRRSYPRLSIAGASAGSVTQILWTNIYLHQVQIFGVSHGIREEADRLFAWIRSGELKPVLHGTFRLSEIHGLRRKDRDRSRLPVGAIWPPVRALIRNSGD